MKPDEESSEVREVVVDTTETPGIDEVLEDMGQPARSAINSSPRTLVGEVVEALPTGRVLVRWEDGRGEPTERELPIVRGLELQEGDRVLLEKPENWPDYLVTNAIEQSFEPSGEIETEMSDLAIRVDGKRVEIEAADEIVLKCGEASITLRRNGRVVIRGTYVETRSKGTNRIKGGSVQIN